MIQTFYNFFKDYVIEVENELQYFFIDIFFFVNYTWSFRLIESFEIYRLENVL